MSNSAASNEGTRREIAMALSRLVRAAHAGERMEDELHGIEGVRLDRSDGEVRMTISIPRWKAEEMGIDV